VFIRPFGIADPQIGNVGGFIFHDIIIPFCHNKYNVPEGDARAKAPFLLGDRIVLLAESPEGSEIRIYKFEETGDEITVTRMALAYDGLFDVGQADPSEPAFNFKPPV
jgi:hypothetical protein